MSPPITHYDISELAPFKNALATGSRLVWLYQIDVPTSDADGRAYRFARSTERGRVRSKNYVPFPFTHESMMEGATGDLPTLSMSVSNVSREIIGTLENYNGLIGQRVKIMLVLMTENQETSAQEHADAILEWEFKITSMTASAAGATAQLGDISLYEVFMPASRISKRYCRFKYKGAGCGYLGLLDSCDKTLDGPNGCEAHGGDSAFHPERFGGFPGVPLAKTGGLL